ncbi:MAG: acyl-CoA dehydrogenase family protein [Trebonia sp.]
MSIAWEDDQRDMESNQSLTGLGGLADQLAPSIMEAADELNAGPQMPAMLINRLRHAGAFHLLTPRELGGHETTLTTALEVYEELGRVDASVASLVWNANWGFIGALLGEAGRYQIWPDGQPGPVIANCGTPLSAVPTSDGSRLSGDWRRASASNVANWFVAITGTRLFAIPADLISGENARRDSTARVGSIFVPDELTVQFDMPPRINRQLYRSFIPALVLPGAAAVALGTAASAVDVMRGRSPHFETVVAESDAELQAARMRLFAVMGMLESTGEAGAAVSAQDRTDLGGAMDHAARVSERVLVAMRVVGSAASPYTGNPVDRRFTDGMAVLRQANRLAHAFGPAARLARHRGLRPETGT